MRQSFDYAFYSNNVTNDSQGMSEFLNSRNLNELSNSRNLNEFSNLQQSNEYLNNTDNMNIKNDPIKIKRIKNLKTVLWFLIALIIASVIVIVVVALLPGNTAPLVTLSPIPYRP